MARKASPIGLRTWVWILAGLFVVCTLPLMAIALVQGTLRFTAAEDNLASLRQLRQTFDLANLVSAERGPANSLLGADPADAAEQAPLAAQLAAARKRVDAALLQLDTVFKADPGVVDEHGLLADAQRRLQSARAAVDRVVAQPHDARRVEEVERAISGMFAVVDRLHLLTSAQINVLVSADREAAIPAMQGQVLIDLREHGGRLASNVMAPVAVPGAWREEQVRAALQTEGRLLELWRLAGSHESVFRSDPELSWHWDMARRQFFGESLPMIEQLIEDGRRGLPPPWTAAEFTTRYVPTLQSLEALRDGYLSVSIARFERTRNREAMRLAVLVATALGTLVVLGVALRIAHRQILQPLLQAQTQVIQLASDAPGPEQHVTHPLAEMQRLFDAIEVLREKSRERSALTSELRQLAGTDELTGLLNRRALDEVVQQRHAGGDASAVVILLDVDRFKAINDGHGHDAGDEVLVRVAQLLRHQLRRSDSIARYGGEEFLVRLADGDLAGGRQLAESLRLALQQMDIALAGGTVLRVTASFGVAEGGTDALGWRTLLRAADAAMYRAKAQGHDRCAIFDEDMREEAMRSLDLEADLRRAINNRDFVPFYQPIVRLSDGEVVGHEALLRWQHERRGLLLPGAFLELGEESGLIEQVDWLIYEQVIAGLARGGEGYVSVNVSPRHFRSAEFSDRLFGLLDSCGADPRRLRLEITEVALLDDGPHTLRILQGLRERGIQVQLDDFGTGFSALSYLHRFPISTLKIDQSFIAGLHGPEVQSTRALVEGVLSLARTLGIETIGEGIETDAQRQTLRELGCDYGQGYLLGRPAPWAHAAA